MILHPPTMITARLLPGVRVGNAFVSLEPTCNTDSRGATKWRWYIDIGNREFQGDDLSGWGGTQEMLENLLAFLGAAAESFPNGENADLSPAPVVEWAHQNSDELSMLACELEETKNLIEE